LKTEEITLQARTKDKQEIYYFMLENKEMTGLAAYVFAE